MRAILSITKALSDETRLRALLTVKNGELCVCQIIHVLGLAPSTVSKHMKVLQDAGLVVRRKQGRWHYYRLADVNANSAAGRALRWILKDLGGDATVRSDSRRTRLVRRQDLAEVSECYRT
jgi:ArsR family transcriptional regulator, arsenate/arsenite/antimonite-responsive transcriptional repressor